MIRITVQCVRENQQALYTVNKAKLCASLYQEFMNERFYWMNGWMNEWMNKWMNEWLNENECGKTFMIGDRNEEIRQNDLFCAFQTFAWLTDWPTDRPTNQPTDMTSYRSARTHLKRLDCSNFYALSNGLGSFLERPTPISRVQDLLT